MIITKPELDEIRTEMAKLGQMFDQTPDDVLVMAIVDAADEYEMTVPQAVNYLIYGEVPHPDAPPHLCGCRDPRDNDKWCVRARDHEDFHSHVKEWEGK